MFNFIKRMFDEKYFSYAIDRQWFKHISYIMESTKTIYPKLEFENILKKLLEYREKMKEDEKLKLIITEEIGDINILIEKIKDRIKNHNKYI